MRKVYICSPYKGNVIENIKKAEEYSKEVYKLGFLPICVHIYLEKATGLNEKNGDREMLLKLGREMVNLCDEVWVFGQVISEGMKKEIKYAERKGIKICFYNDFEHGKAIPM